MIPFSLFNASGLVRLGVALALLILLWLAVCWSVALP